MNNLTLSKPAAINLENPCYKIVELEKQYRQAMADGKFFAELKLIKNEIKIVRREGDCQ